MLKINARPHRSTHSTDVIDYPVRLCHTVAKNGLEISSGTYYTSTGHVSKADIERGLQFIEQQGGRLSHDGAHAKALFSAVLKVLDPKCTVAGVDPKLHGFYHEMLSVARHYDPHSKPFAAMVQKITSELSGNTHRSPFVIFALSIAAMLSSQIFPNRHRGEGIVSRDVRQDFISRLPRSCDFQRLLALPVLETRVGRSPRCSSFNWGVPLTPVHRRW